MPLLDGNDPMGGSQERYIKEELVHQCTVNHERLEVLLGEIEKMDGNAGAIVGALTQVCPLSVSGLTTCADGHF